VRTETQNAQAHGGIVLNLLVPIVVALSVSYTLALFAVSRRTRQLPLPAPADLLVVCLVPCLDEELVVGASIERLLSLRGAELAVLVVDDGSSDGTADIVGDLASRDRRVMLLSRRLPAARQGKGQALNAGYRHLLGSPLLRGRRDRDVVVLVVDADGRVAPNALTEVAPYFRDPLVGAVQIGVRMTNRNLRRLTRLQDMEFVTYTEVFQRGRSRLGSIGLGGNGQFARLAALRSLGDAPWTDCLTEDLDLGVRLLTGGWANAFCPTTYVAQQAVPSFRRLLRQRSRWFQGHLQCLRLIPTVLRSRLPLATALDLCQHLLAPLLVLLTSLLPIIFLGTVVGLALHHPENLPHALVSTNPLFVLLAYGLTFGPSPFYAFVYWLGADEVSYWQALRLAHLYAIYAFLWFPAGWIGLARTITGRRSWAKTARTASAAG